MADAAVNCLVVIINAGLSESAAEHVPDVFLAHYCSKVKIKEYREENKGTMHIKSGLRIVYLPLPTRVIRGSWRKNTPPHPEILIAWLGMKKRENCDILHSGAYHPLTIGYPGLGPEVWSAAPRRRTDHTQQVNLELQRPRKMIGGNGRKELSEGTQTPGSEEGAIGLLILAAGDGARDIHE
ncbi:predicted protein [Histoplasma capsulatum H143]|uniref:Uncharacterized protein n=1 Tax=Ajellomyces capsulatus (strain H143) TaxID=544712 RepID=C6HM62_AJECH|nr:predicted protein [Histoplasma capsulatum H143]